jgi:tRNA(Ile)-lysidine synthase
MLEFRSDRVRASRSCRYQRRMAKQKRVRARASNLRQTVRRPLGLSKFARSLLREWRKLDLPQAPATIVVAVSGGADSAALLFALDELIKSKKLKIKIVIAHCNHKLRGKASDADARWVENISRKLRHPLATSAVDVKKRAAKSNDNLEQAARRARYEFLERTANARKAKAVLTAHTMDDQAETVLLNLLRGSGADGLSGIEPVRSIAAGSSTLLARPLLAWAKRSETEDYCRERSIDFRVDEMNVDESFARVRVRRQLLPLMKSFNPKFVESVARATEILREDSLALESAASRLLEMSLDGPAKSRPDQTADSLQADLLRLAPPALRRRALRLWLARQRGDLRRLERVHIIAVDNLLLNNKGGRIVELPGGSKISRKSGLLHFRCPK